MSEVEIGNNKIRGFGALIYNLLAPLNETDKFKKKFEDTHVKILINAINVNFAALIIIDNGELRVESIPNKPKENLKKKNIGWDGFLQMDSQIFLAFVMNRMSLLGIAKKWIIRKIKLQGISKLLYLLKLVKILMNNNN
ncbi:MAG: hypothetical protein ACFFB0_03270 [Promethearchaeota archaeon]